MKKFLTFAFSAIVLLVPFAASADSVSNVRQNLSSGLTEKGVGLAAHGYDVVAYFTQGRAVVGSARFTTVHDGGAFRFSSAENLRSFERNPEKFAPQYGGYCAYGVYAGAKFDGNPLLWKVVDGKLYFNLNEEIQSKWLQDLSGHISKADRNWAKIGDKAPAELK